MLHFEFFLTYSLSVLYWHFNCFVAFLLYYAI